MKEKEFLIPVRERLDINELNPMQRKMLERVNDPGDIILLSPTGTGKTLAFALPLLKLMRPSTGRIQAVVIAPSRELVLQTAEVLRLIAAGLKVTALYGGHKVEDEVNSLRAGADIIVATPGRLLDHSRRHNLELLPVRLCVLDEFDKSLELGFEEDMSQIFKRLKNLSRIILTSATDMAALPPFLSLNNPATLSFLDSTSSVRRRMKVHRVISDNKDKLEALLALLHNIAAASPDRTGKSIIFVNHRESAVRVCDFLQSQGVSAVLYHGALDQREREKAIAMFNNGSRPILVATDLAARGLDIEGVDNIVHYHMPDKEETYTHRNGRTARVDASGDIYLLTGPQETIAPFIEPDDTLRPDPALKGNLSSSLVTLYISAGRKEKLSKGDILGFLCNDGGLPSGDIGRIDVRDHYALVSLSRKAAEALLSRGNAFRIKGEKRRIAKA